MNAEEQKRRIVVRLDEKKDALWRQLAPHTNEMITRKQERKLFPSLDYHIEGLEGDKMYAMILEFHQVNDHFYKFWNGEWVLVKGDNVTSVESKTKPQQINHPSGLSTGKQWMATGVNFSRVKITNDPNNKNAVFLRTMFKYVPILSVYELPTNVAITSETWKPVAVVKIEYTEFIPTTRYKNKSLCSLKIAINPAARRFFAKKSNDENKKRLPTSSSPDFCMWPPKKVKFDIVSPSTDILPLPTPFPPLPLFSHHFPGNPFMMPPSPVYSPFLLQAAMMANTPFFPFGGFPSVSTPTP